MLSEYKYENINEVEKQTYDDIHDVEILLDGSNTL